MANAVKCMTSIISVLKNAQRIPTRMAVSASVTKDGFIAVANVGRLLLANVEMVESVLRAEEFADVLMVLLDDVVIAALFLTASNASIANKKMKQFV